MADRVVTCANCGARYNLPASFTAAKAKCKKCGSAIDVAASQAAEEEPQAEEPQAPAPRAGGRAAAARGRAGSGANKGEFVKMGTEKKKSGAMIAIGICAFTVMVFVLWLTKGGSDKKVDPKTDKTAAADAGKNAANAASANASAKKDEPKPAEPKPAEQKPPEKKVEPAKEPDKLAAAQGSTPPTPKETPKNTTSNTARWEPETPKETPNAAPVRTEIQKVTGKDGKTKDVTVRYKATPPFDCKSLKPLEFLATTPKEKVDEFKALAADAMGDDGRARRAQTALKKAGREALPAIINALRELDYSKPEQVMTGFLLNKLLEEMTKGVNMMYRNVKEPDEQPKQDDIYYNNTTVKTWQEFWTTFGANEAEWNKVLTRNDWQDKSLEGLGK